MSTVQEVASSATGTSNRNRGGRPSGVVPPGARIRMARELNCLTRDGLARRLGVSSRTVQRAENGRRVSRQFFSLLCSHLALDIGAWSPDEREMVG